MIFFVSEFYFSRDFDFDSFLFFCESTKFDGLLEHLMCVVFVVSTGLKLQFYDKENIRSSANIRLR